MITEIFVQSFFGTLLSVKSERLTYDAFKSNWITSSTRYKRALQILIERTLRPISIYAGGLFALNLATMIQVLY